MNPLAVIESHPVQYHAPVYRALQQQHGVPVVAIYGSDFSVAGYRDREFGADLAWDTDLVSGYSQAFLGRVATGGGADVDAVRADGLATALDRVRPSAILLLGYGSAFNRAAWFAAWRQGAPLLFRGETSDVAVDRTVLRRMVRRFALRTAYARCQALIYIGERSRQHFEALGQPASRLYFSPYCVDTTPFRVGDAARADLRAATRRALDIADDRLVVLFSGKLSERKGVDLLLPAMGALPDSLRTRTMLLLVGDGDLRECLAREGGGAVRSVGFRNQTQLSAFYHAADLLVLPSRHSETWGLVVNEALHHGVPCVVSDRVGCAPDLVVAGRTGAVCVPDDAAALSASMSDVLTSLAGRKATREGCRAHVARYSVDAAAAGLAEAYHAAIDAQSMAGAHA